QRAASRRRGVSPRRWARCVVEVVRAESGARWRPEATAFRLEDDKMHPSTNTMIVIICIAVALMLVGFGLRDRNLGLGLMGLGLIVAVLTIVYKAYITFSSFY
ncbi:hypothetical protein, partial [Bordetella trematum]